MEKKTKINLLAIQMSSVIGQLEANVAKVEQLLEEALVMRKSDFVFLPEVWTVGWDCPSFVDCAEKIDDAQSVKMLQKIAKKYSVNIIGGSFIEKGVNGVFFNTCPVINRNGEIVCTYKKNHLFSYYGCDEGKFIQVGKNPVMVELDGVKIGLTICYDIRFPEIYRAYRKAGADLLVNMAAWGSNKRIPWVSMTTSRAVENQTYFLALTQTGELREGANLGYSMILDYKGEVLADIEKEEGGIFATIDLDEMYKFRDKCRVLEDIKESYEVIVR